MFALFLLAPALAAAEVLVSNLGQPAVNKHDILNFRNDQGQGFTTGSNSFGYSLESVEVKFNTAPSGLSVKLATGLPTATTVVATLSNPSSLTAGDLTFTAPANTTLSANTTYFVVVEASSGNIRPSNSHDEDSGAAAGWSIGNVLFWRKASSTGSWSSQHSSYPMRIRVNGADLALESDAGDDVTVRAGARVALDGTGSLVISSATYAWTQTAGPAVTLDDATSATPAFTAPSVSASTDLTFSLTVKVGEDSVTDTVTVTVLPSRVVSATVDGTALTVTFDSALDATSRPPSSAFTVTATKTRSSRSIRGTGSSVAISGRTVTAALESAVAPDEAATVRYDKPASGAVLEDSSNTALPSFANRQAVNDGDKTAPRFASATANGTALTVTFDEALDETKIPPLGSFTVKVDGAQRTPAFKIGTSARVSGRTVTGTLASAVTHDESVTVEYSHVDAAGRDRVRDLAGNAAPNFTEKTVTNNTPPAYSSASVDGATLTVTFDGALDTGSVPAADAFTVKATRSGTERDVALAATNPVSISGSAVTLTLAEAVLQGTIDTAVTVAYAEPAANPLRDADNAKNPVTGFDGTKTVTNDTPADTTAPTLSSAAVNGATLTLTFDEALDESSVPHAGRFGALIGGVSTAPQLNSVRLDGATVTMTLNVSARHGQTVKPFYNRPTHATAMPLRDLLGNEVVDIPFTDVTATNNTPPAFKSASVDGATLTVTFDVALDTGSVPASDAFTVKATRSGTERDVALAATNPVSISGSAVTLTLAEAVLPLPVDTVTVAYAEPAANPLRAANNPVLPVPGFTAQSVANDTPADTTAPRFASATANGTVLTVTFDEALDETKIPALGSFTVKVDGTQRIPAFKIGSSARVSGRTVTGTLASAVAHDESVTVEYSHVAAPGRDRVRDLAGNAAPNFTEKAVTNNTPPAYSSAFVNGDTMAVTFDGALDTGSVPAADAFTVKATRSGTERDVALAATNPVSISGSAVTLRLAEAVLPLPVDTVTVAYAEPAANPLRDADNAKNPVTGFDGTKTVTNDTPADTTAPRFASATANGTVLTVTFDEALDETKIPALGSFTVKVDGTQRMPAFKIGSSARVSGRTVTGTLASAVAHPHQVTVRYVHVDAAGRDRVRDLAGNAAPNFTDEKTVTNNTPPAFSAAFVNGDTMAVTFDGALDTGSVPAADAFTVKATRSGTERDVDLAATNPVSISGSAVTLRLAEAVLPLPVDTVTVAYAEPAANPLRDADNAKNPVTGFDGTKTVTNDTPADTTAPRFASATVNGATLTLTFDEALDETKIPALGSFTVKVDGTQQTPAFKIGTSARVSGRTVTGTLASAVAHDESVTVEYSHVAAPGRDRVRDLAGNAAPNFTEKAVTNNTPPAYSSAFVNGDTMAVTFDGALDTGSVPAADAFTVKATRSGTERDVDLAATNPVSISGSAVTLTLAEAVLPLPVDTVTVAYAEPAANPLRDADNAKNPVTGFTAQSVANDTPADTTAPRFASATANGATLTLTFDEALDETKIPALGSFTVKVDGTQRIPAFKIGTSARVSGRTVTGTLASAVAHDESVTVEYSHVDAAGRDRVRDLAGNAAPNFTEKAVTNNTPPAYSSASVDGATLTVTFDGALDTGSVPAADAFTVKATRSGTERDVDLAATNPVSISGSAVTLRLAEAVLQGTIDTAVTVAYAEPAANPLRDADNAKNPVTGFDGTKTVTNDTPADTTAPTLFSAAVNGATLTLTFDEALDESSVPHAGRFGALIGGVSTAPQLNSVRLDGATVTMTLNVVVRHGQTVKPFYNRPTHATAMPLRDLLGNEVVDIPFTDVTATNNTPPAFKSASVDGATLTVTFDVALDTGSVPAPAAFTVTVDGTDQTPAAAAFKTGEADKVELTLDPAVAHGSQTVTVSYAAPSTAPLRAANNPVLPVPDFSGKAVTNNAPADTRAPEFSSASVDGTTLTLAFDEALDGSSVPAEAAFTVTAGGGEMDFAATNPVAVDGTTVTLRLAGAVLHGQAVTVGYTRPTLQGASRLRDASGNEVATFAGEDVTNRAPAPAPTVVSVAIESKPSVDETYGKGEHIRVKVTWSSEVLWDVSAAGAALAVRLDVGGTVRMARLSTGGATDGKARALVFRYTVVDGDSDTDGFEVTPTVAGDLVVLASGATLKDGQDRNASRTHPGLYGGEGHKVDGGGAGQPPGPPEILSASVAGVTLTLTFEKALAEAAEPARAARALRQAFIVQGGRYQGAPVINQSPNRVAVSGSTVRLTLGQAAAPGLPVTVTYFKEAAAVAHRLKFTDGEEVASIDNLPVANASGADPAPRLSRATVEGRTLVLFFTEALDESSVPMGTRFAVSGVAGEGVSVSGEMVVVTLARALPDDARAAWVRYVKGNDTKPLRGASAPHHKVAEIRNWRAAVLERTGPSAGSGSVSGTDVTLYFDEALDGGSVPATGAFTVTVAGSSHGLATNGVAVEGTAVSLTLASAAAAGETVAVTYAKPGSNRLKDMAGNEADGFSLSLEAVAAPTGKPALAETDPAVGSGNTLTLTFDQLLDPESVPGVELFTLSSNAFEGVTAVTVLGEKAVLRLARTFTPCDTGKITVSYAAPTANALQSRSGMEADKFTGADAVVVKVEDAGGAECEAFRGEFSTGSIIMRAVRPFATDAPPRKEWFTVAASGGPVTVTEAAFSPDDPRVLTLSLSRDLAEDETAAVSYTRPLGARGLWYADGNQIADVVDAPVTGKRPAASVEAVAVVSDPGADATYAAGDAIWVRLTFDEAVDVDTAGGTPRLKLDLDPEDGGERWAAYESGGGTAALVFGYAAAAGDASPGGVAVVGDTLEPNGGTIRSAAGADAALGHAGLAPDPAHRVDAAAPGFASAEVSGAALTVTFGEALDAGSAPAGSAFTVRAAPAGGEARAIAGTGTAGVEGAAVTVTLAEPVAHGETVTVAYAPPEDGPVRDLAGNAAAAFSGEAAANGTLAVPSATAVAVVSDAGSDATYALGETIRVQVTFSEAVSVDTEGGKPRLTIKMDPTWGEFRAAYAGGSGTEALTFTHTVAEPNTSPRGIAVLANTLELNGGTIRSKATGADADLAHAGLGHDAAHKVNWRIAPSDVTAVAVVSDAGDDDTYALGETIRIRVTFTEAVSVDTAGGTPGLTIKMDPGWGEFRAAYENGSGTEALTFTHTVAEPNTSPRGIAVLANTLETGGGAIRLAATSADARLPHAGLGHDPAHKVNWRLSPQAGPSVVAAAVVPASGADGAWGEGETVEAAVTFERAVAVDAEGGTPTLALIVDGTIRRAPYAGGDGTERLVFAYRVAKADGTLRAVRVAASGLKLNGGSVVDATDGTPALLGFGEAPGVTEVSITDEPDGRWEAGDTVEAVLRFAEPVTVEGAPGARFVLGGAVRSALWGTPRKATYAGGSGSDALTLRYTLGEGEGPWIRAVLVSNTLDAGGGSIRSAGGGLAAALEHIQGQRTLAPVERPVAVTGVAVVSDSGSDDTYALGETIEIRVTFGAAVSVDTAGGTPRLTIKMDPTWGEFRAAYAGGDGTEALTFTHTVAKPNTSPRGIAVLANTLETNGGAIRSASGKDASLAHAGLGHDPRHKVDWRRSPPSAGAPTVTGVAVVSDAGDDDTYVLGDVIRIGVTFSEAVKVDGTGGTPRLMIRMDPGWGTFPAAWEGGDGTSRLTFTHTVVPPNTSPRGIAVLANTLETNGGTIRSAATGVDASLAHAGLPHDPRHKVDWRPELSVADAEARERIDATIDFVVSLRGDASAGAVVEYATADGTATAWRDYRPVGGMLIFLPDERRKVVKVPIIDDGHDEGRETFTFRLFNARGARIVDGEATGTIVNSDPIPKAWIARFGRTVTGQVLDAVEARLAAPRAAGGEASLAGQALPTWTPGSGSGAGGEAAANDNGSPERASLAGGGDLSAADAMRRWMRFAGAENGDPGGTSEGGAAAGFGGFGDKGRADLESREVTQRDLLTGTSFALTAQAGGPGGGFASLWGRGAISSFDGREGNLTLDGEVTTGLIGADWSSAREGPGSWTAGLTVGHSTGTGGYRTDGCGEGNCGGEIEATLTGLYPYAGAALTDRLSVWLAAGYGAGEVTVRPDGTAPFAADLAMSMGAAGLRSEVLKPENGNGLSLALKGAGRFTRTESDAATNADGGRLAAAEADVWMLRTGIEGSRAFALGDGKDSANITPSFEIGVRLDGGDAETGLGADLGGGLAFAEPANGLSLDLKARALVAHEASGFREWGASASFGWDPRPETDRGLSLSLIRTLGAAPSGGMDALLSRETLADLAANDDGSGSGFEAAGRLEGEIGYGLPVLGGGFTGTPNLGFGLSDNGGRDWRIGWRLTSAVPGDPGFEVSLDATRKEPANDSGSGTPVEHGVMLRAAIRW